MEGRESMGLMMPNIMTADLMLRTVSILTQRGRNLMSKMVFFDEECRKLFISICQKHGLDIDVEPVFGGARYLEKQDFIIMNQQKRIDENGDRSNRRGYPDIRNVL